MLNWAGSRLDLSATASLSIPRVLLEFGAIGVATALCWRLPTLARVWLFLSLRGQLFGRPLSIRLVCPLRLRRAAQPSPPTRQCEAANGRVLRRAAKANQVHTILRRRRGAHTSGDRGGVRGGGRTW